MDKHIYTLDSSESKDGHEYTLGIEYNGLVHIIYVHRDGEVFKQFSTQEAAEDYLESKRKD